MDSNFTIVLLAFVLDLLLGEPSFIPHPVILAGKLIAWTDSFLNRGSDRKLKGILAVALFFLAAGIIGQGIEQILLALPLGGFWLALIMSWMIASRSLYDHVLAVKKGLSGSLEKGRQEVAKICGRDPQSLDEAGIARGAIESLAESFCDGIVAPLFWGCLFGLPGIFVYKMINTADSMIGHKNEAYQDFGWASAKLDDLMNWIPARIAALILILAGAKNVASLKASWLLIRSEAPKHESPNAGWPETAIGVVLGLGLGGPRFYDSIETDDAWLNENGRKDAGIEDIGHALQVFRQSLAYIAIFLGLSALIWH